MQDFNRRPGHMGTQNLDQEPQTSHFYIGLMHTGSLKLKSGPFNKIARLEPWFMFSLHVQMVCFKLFLW